MLWGPTPPDLPPGCDPQRPLCAGTSPGLTPQPSPRHDQETLWHYGVLWGAPRPNLPPPPHTSSSPLCCDPQRPLSAGSSPGLTPLTPNSVTHRDPSALWGAPGPTSPDPPPILRPTETPQHHAMPQNQPPKPPHAVTHRDPPALWVTPSHPPPQPPSPTTLTHHC